MAIKHENITNCFQDDSTNVILDYEISISPNVHVNRLLNYIRLLNFSRNPLDMDDFDDDDTEEILDDKDKDVKLPNKYNLQAGPV